MTYNTRSKAKTGKTTASPKAAKPQPPTTKASGRFSKTNKKAKNPTDAEVLGQTALVIYMRLLAERKMFRESKLGSSSTVSKDVSKGLSDALTALQVLTKDPYWGTKHQKEDKRRYALFPVERLFDY